MKKIFLTVFAISFLLVAKSQFTYNYLKAADDYYKKADYYSAAQYYEKYLGTDGKIKANEYDPYVVQTASVKQKQPVSNKEQAVYNLAESYRLLRFYVKAEPYYAQASAFNETAFPLADYHYATTLRALGKFEEAEKAFQQFLAEYKAADSYTEAASREIDNLRFIKAQMNRKDIDQYKIGSAESFSSEGANYAPVWVSASKILFTTTRPDGSSTKKEFLNKIYEAGVSGGAYGTPAKLSISQPGEVHQGGAAISADGNTMYFTRWTVGEGKKTANIYYTTNVGNTWTEPIMLKGLSAPGTANDKQPFIMPDGKLLFSSDREGGLGGFDLWTADIANGEAANVVNLGPVINTKFDEQAPYYHAPSQTLVLASNGRIGMGGFDLFFSPLKNGSWTQPENFGYPVNSIKNDMYFTSIGGTKNILENVLFSSDRAAECCMQMFALSKAKQPNLVAGTVVDCKTNQLLAGVKVEVKNEKDNVVFSGTTTAGGAYNFTMEELANLKIAGTLKGYFDNTTVSTVSTETTGNMALPVLCLNPIPDVNVAEVIDNIYFAFDKAVVLEESHASMDKLAKMLIDNPTVEVEISGHTDSKGNDNYNKILSAARAKNVVKYLVSQGVDEARLTAKGYGETMPVAPNKNDDGSDNPEGREKNRRTEYKVIRK